MLPKQIESHVGKLQLFEVRHLTNQFANAMLKFLFQLLNSEGLGKVFLGQCDHILVTIVKKLLEVEYVLIVIG